MARAFASQADMAEKKITFSRLSEHAYAFTAEGDPNTGIVVGEDGKLSGTNNDGNGYDNGYFAPGRRESKRVVNQAYHHALLAHGHAVAAVREHVWPLMQSAFRAHFRPT